MARLAAAGERFAIVAGASSGSVCGAVTVAGLAARGPEFARALAGAPIFSRRYLATERSPFGMRLILETTLRENLPEALLHDTEAELLVSTTHAGAFARRMMPQRWHSLFPAGGKEEPLVVHSNRERRDLHEVLLASCYIPILHAGFPKLNGALHVDGALADNTLLDALAARGATDITVVTPFVQGHVAASMFTDEAPLRPRKGVRYRVLSPERPLSIGRFDLAPDRIEEALGMPHVETIIEPA